MIPGAEKVTPGGQSGPLGNNWARRHGLELWFGVLATVGSCILTPSIQLLFPAPTVCEVVESFISPRNETGAEVI